MHVVPEQHPFGHVLPLQLAHVPALQMRFPQSWHCAPPAPHTCSSLPGSHVVPEQHPVHVAGSHSQVPPTHF